MTEDNGYHVINTNENIKASSKIAAFDLDHTLIKPNNGRVFPKDFNDWIILDGVSESIQQLFEEGYKIVVFTNQSGSFVLDLFTQKIKNIFKKIGVDAQIFISTGHGIYRKPNIGMMELLEKEYNNDIKINIKESFYVGDAAGRPDDFSDSDLKFALNLGLKFFTSVGIEYKGPIPIHPLKIKLPEVGYNSKEDIEPLSVGQEMIILVGPPASGKSTFAKRFPNYVVVCQDDLKTKPKVIKAITNALNNGSSVIIDRKNEYLSDRSEFIAMAKKINIPVKIVFMDIPKELSLHLSTYREITTGIHISSIVFNKYYSKEKGLEVPDESEALIFKLRFKIDPTIVSDYKIFTRYLV